MKETPIIMNTRVFNVLVLFGFLASNMFLSAEHHEEPKVLNGMSFTEDREVESEVLNFFYNQHRLGAVIALPKDPKK
ncbi:MAG: hypothetical protein CMI18_04875 [Opitutaceae bacterium]|nr:hypothetical protein [Opitutaceae bacterium]